MSESDTGTEAQFHEMRKPRVEKVVVHMGVGQGGRELANAEDILTDITGQQPVQTEADETIPAFNVREGDPVGAKVTLRDERAHSFLETALPIGTVKRTAFDDRGNFSFGITEHTDFPDQEYDPSIGIYGLDVTVNLVRPGYRIAKRDKQSRSIPSKHQLSVEDAIAYIEQEFDVEVTN